MVSGLDDSEPGIDVASDATLYVNAPQGLGFASHVWRSTDSGLSWALTPAGTRGALPGGGDADIAVDRADGTVYMTDLWLGSATVSVSHDRAQTWTANPLEGVVVQDRQWVATSGGGIVYHVTHQIPAGLVVSKSVDGGVTYPVSTVAATPVDQTDCVCPPGTLVAAAGTGGPAGLGDKVGVIYATSTGGVKFAHSGNGAASFTTSSVSPSGAADTAANFPVVADAGGGRLVAVWLEISSSPAWSHVRFSSSSDWGTTWDVPRTLVSAGTSVFPWVDARGGKVAVSLYHTSSPGTPDTVSPSAKWYESELESADGGGTFGPLASADTTVAKTGPVCTEGLNCGSGRELGDFQQVALDPLGRANLAYNRSIDGSDTEVRFVRRN